MSKVDGNEFDNLEAMVNDLFEKFTEMGMKPNIANIADHDSDTASKLSIMRHARNAALNSKDAKNTKEIMDLLQALKDRMDKLTQ